MEWNYSVDSHFTSNNRELFNMEMSTMTQIVTQIKKKKQQKKQL